MVTLDTTALHTTVSRSSLEIQFYRKRNDAHHAHALAFTFFSPPGGSATEPGMTVSRSAVRVSSTPQLTSPSQTSPTPTAARTPRRDGGILTPTLYAVGAAGLLLLLLLLVIGVATVLVAVCVLKARAGHREKEQMSMHGMTLQYS